MSPVGTNWYGVLFILLPIFVLLKGGQYKNTSCGYLLSYSVYPPLFIDISVDHPLPSKALEEVQNVIYVNGSFSVNTHKSFMGIQFDGPYLESVDEDSSETPGNNWTFSYLAEAISATVHIPVAVNLTSVSCVEFPGHKANCERDDCPQDFPDLYNDWNLCAILYSQVRCKQCNDDDAYYLTNPKMEWDVHDNEIRSIFVRPGCAVTRNLHNLDNDLDIVYTYFSNVDEIQVFRKGSDTFSCKCQPGILNSLAIRKFNPTVDNTTDDPSEGDNDSTEDENINECVTAGFTTVTTLVIGAAIGIVLAIGHLLCILPWLYYLRQQMTKEIKESQKISTLLSTNGNSSSQVLSQPTKFTPNVPPLIQTKTSTESNFKQENTPWKSEQPIILIDTHPIGQGTFSQVWKVQHTFGQKLALKQIFLNRTLLKFGGDLEKLYREIKHSEQITSPYIVKHLNCWAEGPSGLIDLKEVQSLTQTQTESTVSSSATVTLPEKYFLFVQMELCDFTLKNWLHNHPTIESRINIETRNSSLKKCNTNIHSILSQLGQGLKAIHEQGIIHRDIKPDNIFCKVDNGMGNQCQWKIGDFGLSIDKEEVTVSVGSKSRSCPGAKSVAGCSHYKSPEMSEGLVYSSKTDVFSLGLVFLEIMHCFRTTKEKSNIFFEIQFGTGIGDYSNMLETLLGHNFPSKIQILQKMMKQETSDRIDTGTLCRLLN